MLRIAANVSLLFTEAPALARPALAAQAGFDGCEILFPYDHPPEVWAQHLASLPLALINTPPGDWQVGQRGFAAVAGAESRFRDDFTRALAYARHLRSDQIHIMAGIASGPEAEAVFMRNLDWAAAQAPAQSLTIEPLNPTDMPGYFLNSFDQAARLLETLDHPNLGLQFDFWHAHKITGNVVAAWDAHGKRATHVQIAGLTARHEPDAETAALLAHLDAENYAGWISAEYHPATTTSAGLGWLTSLRSSRKNIPAGGSRP